MTININHNLQQVRAWAKARPRRAAPILGAAALLGLLLISMVIALLLKQDTNQSVTPPVEQPVAQVTITADGFIPATLVVKKGTKITWTNADAAMHQIYANPHPTGDSLPGLKSEILNNSQTYEYTADTTGSFGYHDQLTPTTNGTIEIEE